MRKRKYNITKKILAGVIATLSLGLLACGADKNQPNNVVETVEEHYSSMSPTEIGAKQKLDIVTYGMYEEKPIEWYVLENTGNEVTLFSKDILFAEKYEKNQNKESTWEECSLRVYLNGDFYTTAFNESEQKSILLTTIENNPHPYWETDAGNSTEDRVFIPSIDDLEKYLGISKDVYIKYCDDCNVKISDYDIQVGINWINYCIDTAPIIKSQREGVKDSFNWWWLRTPGKSLHSNIYVNYTGEPINGPPCYANGSSGGIRPIIKVAY